MQKNDNEIKREVTLHVNLNKSFPLFKQTATYNQNQTTFINFMPNS